MKYPAYPKYKPSGVEWLGDLPEHWTVKKLKYLADVSTSGVWGEDIEPENDGYPVVTTANIDTLGGIDMTGIQKRALSPGELMKGLCRPGDIIVVKSSGSWSNVISGKAGLVFSKHGAICFSNFTLRVRPHEGVLHSSFAFAFLSSEVVKAQVRLMVATTTYPNLQVAEYVSFVHPAPPFDEQHAIAEFLDRETTKLDTLVAKRRALIEKLKEKRTALISRTVARGLPPEAVGASDLNPNPKLKSSGIEWPGDIPAHWEVVRIGRKITLQRGVDITKDEQQEGSVPVVSSGGVSSFHDTALASGPGVIVGRKGTAGAVYYIETDFWPHDTTLWVREFRNNFPKYVYYKLCSMDLESFDTGSSNPTVNRNLIHPVLVTWPPEGEQHAIADYLDRETAKIDQMVEKVEEAIERLEEYRTALITAAVTGKIDVRTVRRSDGNRNTIPQEPGDEVPPV